MRIQPLVTIIIPVYKAEHFLNECVDSILAQSYENLEVILVDDGSPDNCGVICDRYADSDKRVRVVHQPNKGVAAARNAGLPLAKGEYLFFVDSDDYLAEGCIEKHISVALMHDADMVCAQSCNVDENGLLINKKTAEQVDPVVMDANSAMRYYATKMWGPWNRLIKKEVHENIRFPQYRIHEDEAIKFLLLERCRKVVEIPDILYMYRQHGSSITATDDADRMDMFYSCLKNYQYLEENHKDICRLFLQSLCDSALLNLSLLIRKKDFDRITEITDFAKQYFLRIMISGGVSVSRKLRFVLVAISNWKKETCLYVRFYSRLETIRKEAI